MSKDDTKKVYVNAKQAKLLSSKPKVKVWVGGRGSGKSTLHGALDVLRVQRMPRAKWFKAGLTFNQILTKFLPPAIEFWENCGLIEHKDNRHPGHFVIGRKPPSNWMLPYSAPRRFENVISFWNGCCIELLSMDRSNTDRGGSYDGGDFDEAVLIDKDQHDKELIPSIRGNVHRFNDPLHHASLYTSTQSWLPSGNWVPDKADDAKSFPDEVFYIESTAFDNKDVLGQAYLNRLKRELPPLVYDVEVMNKRVTRLPNAFYPYLEEGKHLYYKSYDYDLSERGVYTKGTNDVRTDEPIDISFDFGAFNSLIVGQMAGNTYRIVDTMFVHNPKILDDLVDEFIKGYAGHAKKHVMIYGDRNGNNRQANSRRTMYEEIMTRIRKAGWTCQLMVRGLDPAHQLKFELINRILKEDESNWPRLRFNQNTCKYLVLSMQGAGLLPDGKKDKRTERSMMAPELSTHISDAFDNLVFRKFEHLQSGVSRSQTTPSIM